MILIIISCPNKAHSFDPEIASFNLKVNAEKVEHNITFRAVLGGEILKFRSKIANTKMVFNEETIDFIDSELDWKAPETPGYYSTSILNDTNTILINIFVMVPRSDVKKGLLGTYRIGTYPPPLKGLDSYKAPNGFIKVTKELAEVKISPHFKLGQFVSKQSSGYPKYVVLRPNLLEKLEFLLEKVNLAGIQTESFVIMSGYRTPYYNKSIGNVANSRHVYGGAADIFIDSNPVNNYMDDLNNDGQINLEDSKYLYAIADKFVKKTGRTYLTGGVGVYKSNSSHGPFIHVDVRGTRARW
jgi:hypothetical protein